MVVMAGGRLRGRGFDSRFGTFFFFFHSFPFFSVSFFPLSFSFMLAPPFQCSSIFLVVECMYVYVILQLQLASYIIVAIPPRPVSVPVL